MNIPPVARVLFTTAARYILGGVFLYAAFEKLIHPDAFAADLVNYRLLPDALVYPIALFLPALELVAGVLIVAGPVKGEAAAFIALMLLAFIGGEVQALARGLDISCGCFGSGSGKINFLSIGRNTVFFFIALFIMAEEARRREGAASRDGSVTGPPGPLST